MTAQIRKIRPRIDPYCVICKLNHPGAVQPRFPTEREILELQSQTEGKD